MSGSESGGDNWNVVELKLVSLGDGDVPVGQRTGVLERRFHKGGYSFARAREIVEEHIRQRASTPGIMEACLALWRGAPNEVGFTLLPYFWSLFQHGESYRDGVESVMATVIPDDISVVEYVNDSGE